MMGSVMGGALLWLVLVFIAATVFALSNSAPVTVKFWQWPVFTGPLAIVVVGAGVCGALLTYLGSLLHHTRQAQQIRTLRESVKAHEARQAQAGPPKTPATSPEPRRPY
jgi:uncharacterized integral membrane protein